MATRPELVKQLRELTHPSWDVWLFKSTNRM